MLKMKHHALATVAGVVTIFCVCIGSSHVYAQPTFGQKPIAAEPQPSDDVDGGIEPGDSAKQKRGGAEVQGAKAKANAARQSKGALPVCSDNKQQVCTTANNSILVAPGARVTGGIFNVHTSK
jgi:hypothetical protein